METYTDLAYKPFKEVTLDALTDKEFFLVELGTASDTVQLATSAANAIGVLYAKQQGNPNVNVRLFGGGGSIKIKAGGVIAKGARVTWGTGGKVVSATTGSLFGRKVTQGSSVDNDIIEIIDGVTAVFV